ncbi:uncharacterized protein LOC113296462 [Papaver somniferum]|uniref:uncharacterized protein LOC113296462 n=1 Tax=Papaver somniferum TaxID=3469 RepID=UPI000E6FE61D|nr:uncharacterized protein LOC113296462 [Papaver somniferum]
MILAVISDAEKRQEKEELVKLSLRRLKDVAYDVDDVMDESLKKPYGGVKDWATSSTRNIKGVNKKLDEITKDMDKFQLNISSTTVAYGESSEQRSRQTTSIRCFSYCSIFPKDWELSKLTLIQLWMAEGFLQPSNVGNDCSFEDIGDKYFESLMWSSFFDGVKTNELGNVSTFKIRDLVHDLAEAVVGVHECSIVKVTDQLEFHF